MIFSKRFFLPYNHAQEVKIEGHTCEHISGFFYFFPRHIPEHTVVSYRLWGTQFLEKIRDIIDSLETLEQKRAALMKSSSVWSGVKSKKIEDLSVTYADSDAFHIIDQEEKKILALLDTYKSFYVV